MRKWNIVIFLAIVAIVFEGVIWFNKANALDGDNCPSYAYAVMTSTGPGCATTLHLKFRTVKK